MTPFCTLHKYLCLCMCDQPYHARKVYHTMQIIQTLGGKCADRLSSLNPLEPTDVPACFVIKSMLLIIHIMLFTIVTFGASLVKKQAGVKKSAFSESLMHFY